MDTYPMYESLFQGSERSWAALPRRYRAEISVLMCEQKSYGFGACAKAIRYSVNIARDATLTLL